MSSTNISTPLSESKPDGRRRPERKIEILQAAMSLLEKGGHVTTAGLAAEIGLSEAALYRHYDSKAAIFQSLVDYLAEHLLKPAERLLASANPCIPQLQRLMEYHLSFFSEHPGMCRVFLVEDVVTPEETEHIISLVREYTGQVRLILALGQKNSELPEELPLDESAQLFVGIIQSSALRFVMSGFKIPPSQGVAATWWLFHRAIGARCPDM